MQRYGRESIKIVILFKFSRKYFYRRHFSNWPNPGVTLSLTDRLSCLIKH